MNETLVNKNQLVDTDARYWNKSFVSQQNRMCSNAATTFSCKGYVPNATIDDVYFFNRSLGDSEMLSLMNTYN